MRSSTKLAIFLALLLMIPYGAYQLWARSRVDGLRFEPLAPGRVNLVAVAPRAGYRVIVANQIAFLVEARREEFEAPDAGDEAMADPNRKRLPLRELLQSLGGDERALAKFVAIVNEIRTDDLVEGQPIWTAEDLRKALDGDRRLADRLLKDLNVGLDGEPAPFVSRRAVTYGIAIDFPVEVDVQVAGQPRRMVARLRETYMPRLSHMVNERVKEKFELTDAMLAGYYAAEARRVIAGESAKEDVRRSLEQRISPARREKLSEIPERIMRNVQVVVNDRQITGARYARQQAGGSRPVFDLMIDFTPEGRDRLWQYSRRNRGFQLLLVTDGVAIGAPRIDTELSQTTVMIRNMPDETLLKEAVEIMTKAQAGERS
jgi:hypothetical protein